MEYAPYCDPARTFGYYAAAFGWKMLCWLAVDVAKRLTRELKLWSADLEPGDDLHEQMKAASADPLFAAMILSESVFEKHQVHRGQVMKVLDDLDGMVQIVGAHHRQHGPEKLGAMREAALARAPFDGRRVQLRIVTIATGHHSPRLSGFQFLECRFQDATGRSN